MINGMPGAGKTTLAPHLAAELGWPLVGKDMLKEVFGDILGVPVEKTAMLGALASDTMWSLAALVDGPVIVESFWRSDRDQEFLRRGLEVANAGPVVEVWCTVPLEVARQRFLTRPRHPIHGDTRRLDEWDSWAAIALPCSGHPVIEVGTDGPVNVAELATRIKAELGVAA
nr:AAA family ATPase [Planctomonas sp. JC2975]